MCGFSGFTKPNYENKDKNLLERMMLPIKHRGPDQASIHVNDKIAMGHFRLSIIDIKGGQQPCMDNNNYLLFNGEIYGYKKIAQL